MRFQCDQCDYRASKNDHIHTHKQSVHEQVRFQCDQCNYIATKKDNLQSHKHSVQKKNIFSINSVITKHLEEINYKHI